MIEPLSTIHEPRPWNVILLVSGLFLLGVALMLLNGCVSGVRPGTPAGNAQVVYQAESDYAAALAAAVAYRNLPRCGGVGPLCHEDKVVIQLQTSDAVASAAIKTAQSAVRAGVTSPSTINAAVNAVQAFFALTATLKVK